MLFLYVIEEYLLDVIPGTLDSFKYLLNYNDSNILYQYKFYFHLSYTFISSKFPLKSKCISLELCRFSILHYFFFYVTLQFYFILTWGSVFHYRTYSKLGHAACLC